MKIKNNYSLEINNNLDYIPIISTINSLTYLFKRCIISSIQKNVSILNKHHFDNLHKKSFSRSLLLLVPVLGNITVGIYDFFSHISYQKKIAMQLSHLDLQNDNEVAIAIKILQEDGLLLKFITKQLQENENSVFNSKILKIGMYGLPFSYRLLAINREIVRTAVQQNGLALEFATDRLKDDKDIVWAAIQQNPLAKKFASSKLQVAQL